MNYGAQFSNPSGELVISSDAKGLYCIGKLALYGSVVQASGSATAGTPGRKAGYSVYRISHSGQIVLAIDAPLNKRVGIVSITQPSAGVWEVTAYCGDTPDAYDIDGVQYQVDIWAFGFVTTAPSGFGMVIYDKYGNPSYDLTKAYPLFPRGYALYQGSAVTIPSLTRPVIMGMPASSQFFDTQVAANTFQINRKRAKWKRTAATTLSAVLASEQAFRYFSPDSSNSDSIDVFDEPAFILEGASLPA